MGFGTSVVGGSTSGISATGSLATGGAGGGGGSTIFFPGSCAAKISTGTGCVQPSSGTSGGGGGGSWRFVSWPQCGQGTRHAARPASCTASNSIRLRQWSQGQATKRGDNGDSSCMASFSHLPARDAELVEEFQFAPELRATNSAPVCACELNTVLRQPASALSGCSAPTRSRRRTSCTSHGRPQSRKS